MKQPAMPRKPKGVRGPKPEILKIEGDWTVAIKKSLQKKRPAGGWPKPV
jgi:hypothetical protein